MQPGYDNESSAEANLIRWILGSLSFANRHDETMTANRKRILSCLAAGVIWLGVIAVLGSCAFKTPAPTPTPTKTPRPSVVTPRPTSVEPVIVAVAATTVVPSPTPTHTAAVTAAPTETTEPTPARTREPAIVETRQPTPAPTEQAVATRAPAPNYPLAGDYFGRGIRVAFGSQSDVEFVTSKAAELKVTWAQFDVLWRDVEPVENQRNWSQLDQAINTFSAAGLNLLVTVQSAPSWARSASSDQSVEGPPANPKPYANFVTDLIKRYKGKVHAIEVWSGANVWFNWGHEPLTAASYTDLLCATFSAVKAVAPDVVVVSGGPEPTNINDGAVAVDDTVYLQKMYQAGAMACFDALGAHPMGYNNPPDKRFGYADPQKPSFKNGHHYFFLETLERYHQVMIDNQDAAKRIWVTEFGWASDPNPPAGLEFARDNSRQEQGDFLVDALRIGKGLGWVGPMFISNLNVALVRPSDEGRIFSLWLKDGPTPAYQRLMALELGD
jgi:hypothetical protein